VLGTALGLRGTKYVSGGTNPQEGFDCSGLVQYVLEQHDIRVPRTVADQFRIGIPVSLRDVKPGDLVFFSTTARGPTHVGIALGQGRFIDAPSTNGVVRIDDLGASYWHNRFVGARRVF
jgi:cell wall-associated NlpC family hydrolase